MSKIAVSPVVASPAVGETLEGEGRRAWWGQAWRSPLWICLCVAIITRAWLIIHTHGVMDGDEATVGIQAEHILRGEFPVYYYGQSYLGNIQAYVIALILFFTGPSVWAMRIEPILTSLLIVWLTWRFAEALGRAAGLPARAGRFFVVIATLVAAFAPLYDVVEEMRVTGGYIEAFALMLWLLLCAFRLTQRWGEGAPRWELGWRWMGLGFLVGLGLWIDPLIVYAYAAIALWIGGYALGKLVRRGRPGAGQTRLALVKDALLAFWGVPAALVGFTPGLIWGAQNNWANIRYILQNSASSSGNRLHTILKVQKVYITCLAPRAMGGALPTQPDVTTANPHILTFGLLVVGVGLAVSAGACLFSLVTRQPVFLRLRRLTLLPLLFFLCASIIFCLASISTGAIYSGCGPVDYVGRYVVALVICLPFFVAAALCLPLLLQRPARFTASGARGEPLRIPTTAEARVSSRLWLAQGVLLGVLALYFSLQGMAYLQADPAYTFHPTGCVAQNPTDVEPLIQYMRQNSLRYAWGSSWIGNRITFETNAALVVTDLPGRIPGASQLVLRQDRPGIFLLVRHTDVQPAFLQLLSAHNVTYRVARFYAEPGIDVLLVLPQNQTVSPRDPTYAAAMKKLLIGCVV